MRHVADRDAEAMRIWRNKGYVPLATGILAAIAAGDEEVLRVSQLGPGRSCESDSPETLRG